VGQVGRWLLKAGQQQLQHQRGTRVATALAALCSICRVCWGIAGLQSEHSTACIHGCFLPDSAKKEPGQQIQSAVLAAGSVAPHAQLSHAPAPPAAAAAASLSSRVTLAARLNREDCNQRGREGLGWEGLAWTGMGSKEAAAMLRMQAGHGTALRRCSGQAKQASRYHLYLSSVSISTAHLQAGGKAVLQSLHRRYRPRGRRVEQQRHQVGDALCGRVGFGRQGQGFLVGSLIVQRPRTTWWHV